MKILNFIHTAYCLDMIYKSSKCRHQSLEIDYTSIKEVCIKVKSIKKDKRRHLKTVR